MVLKKIVLCLITFCVIMPFISVYAKDNKANVDNSLSSTVTVATTHTTTTTIPTTTTTTITTTTPATETTTILSTHSSSTTSVVYCYDMEDLEILSRLIYGEAGGESRECQLAVGSVVLNRVKSPYYKGKTIKDIVFEKGQYACTWDGNFNKIPSQQSIEVAQYLLDNGSVLPDNVVFQAQFEQGSGVYTTIDGEIFCYL